MATSAGGGAGCDTGAGRGRDRVTARRVPGGRSSIGPLRSPGYRSCGTTREYSVSGYNTTLALRVANAFTRTSWPVSTTWVWAGKAASHRPAEMAIRGVERIESDSSKKVPNRSLTVI